jgi:hypothetical protein
MADWSNREAVYIPEITNKETIHRYVSEDGGILKYVSNEFKNDEEIVLNAVSQYGSTLKYASKELRDNEYFLYNVSKILNITSNSYYFMLLSERIQEEIKKDANYLANFEPVNIKPAKKLN